MSILIFNTFYDKMKTKINILVIMYNEKECYVLVTLRNFRRDAQRVCLWILKVSEECLGRGETPRQSSHEHFKIITQKKESQAGCNSVHNEFCENK